MQFIKAHWKDVMLVILTSIIFYLIQVNDNAADNIDIIPVTDTNVSSIEEAMSEVSKKEAQEISDKIIEVKAEKAPEYHYYTSIQEQADIKAREYADEQKADKVMKETSKVDVTGEKGETSSQQVIENNYYAINLEKKHSVEVGAAVIDSTAYITAAYRNRNIKYEALYSPNSNKFGINISATIVKW